MSDNRAVPASFSFATVSSSASDASRAAAFVSALEHDGSAAEHEAEDPLLGEIRSLANAAPRTSSRPDDGGKATRYRPSAFTARQFPPPGTESIEFSAHIFFARVAGRRSGAPPFHARSIRILSCAGRFANLPR